MKINRKMINNITFVLIYILFVKTNEQKTINREYIENPLLYKNEICSYNGNPTIVNENNENKVECSCYSSYVDEPRNEFKKYVGKHEVHCSYKKKKRFTTFFLAGLVPLGLDYFYLEHYLYFAIVCFSFILLLLSYILCFLGSYKLKEMNEESKYKYNDRSDNFGRNNLGENDSNQKGDKTEQIKKCLAVHRMINKIFTIIFVCYWIVDIVLQARGDIKDKNGIETENDMNSLFSREET